MKERKKEEDEDEKQELEFAEGFRRINYPIFATFGRYVDNKIFHDAKILLLKHLMKKGIKIFQGCMVLVTVFAIPAMRPFQ